MSNELDTFSYFLLGTLKKDGTMVDTPVWFGGTEGEYVAFSAGNAGKVKRLRNFSKARVAPCTVTGKPLGPYLAAEAELIDDATGIQSAHRQLLAKYGWQMRLLDFFSWLSGKINKRQFIKVVLKV